VTLTRTGRAVLWLCLLTLLAALASGNNLLYLLYSLLLSCMIVSAAAAWRELRWAGASVEFPEQAFQGSRSVLRVRLKRRRLVRVVWGEERGTEELRGVLPHRGLNRLEDLFLETEAPFGLLRLRRRMRDAVGLALPRPRETRSAAELDADVSASGSLRPSKGAGDDLFGIRDYEPGDDSRLINWKLTARTGRTLVNEYASPVGTKVTVRVPGSAEHAILESASACKHYLDRGAQVRLITPEGNVDYGKGLLHLDRLLRALARLGPGKVPRPAPGPAAPSPEPVHGEVLLGWTYAWAALVCASLPLIDEIRPAWLLACAPVLAAAWRTDHGAKPLLPNAFWTPASWLMLGYVLLIGWRASGVTLANTHLLLFLLADLLLNPKDPKRMRQLALVLFLVFFLISGQTISLWYFLSFVLFAAAGAGWLAGGRVPAKSLAAGLLLTSVLFASTPRFEPFRRMNPFVAMGLDKRAPSRGFVTGFTENVSLGFFGRIRKSSARVMRVRPIVPQGPRSAPLRVRGCSLDRFDGKRWSKGRLDFSYGVRGRTYHTDKGRAWAPRRKGDLVFPGAREAGPVTEFTLLPLNSAVLFTADGLSSVEETDRAAYFDYTDTVYFAAPALAMVRYRVVGDASGAVPMSAGIAGYDRFLGRFLQLPELDPRIPELALKATRGASTPEEKIASVVRYLQRRYAYSTFSDEPDRGLGSFLFKSRNGNCEYFATAAAVLLRTLGIPTRIVTGFLASDWNEYGEFYDVRQGDAHAWTEAYLPQTGWIPIDATPPGGLTGDRRWSSKLLRWFDAAQLGWYRHVIGYDRFMQRNTFYRAHESLGSDAFKSRLRAWPWALGAGGAGAAAWAAAWAWRRRRPAAKGFWGRALRILEKRGVTPLPAQTPREFADAVKGGLPELAQLHYKQRYSGVPLEERERKRAERIVESLRVP